MGQCVIHVVLHITRVRTGVCGFGPPKGHHKQYRNWPRALKKHMILRTNRYEQVRTPNVPPTNPFLMLFLGVCGRCPVNYLRMMTLCGWFSVDLAGTMSCLCSLDMASPLVGFCVAAVWWVWLVTCGWLSGFHSRGGSTPHTRKLT